MRGNFCRVAGGIRDRCRLPLDVLVIETQVDVVGGRELETRIVASALHQEVVVRAIAGGAACRIGAVFLLAAAELTESIVDADIAHHFVHEQVAEFGTNKQRVAARELRVVCMSAAIVIVLRVAAAIGDGAVGFKADDIFIELPAVTTDNTARYTLGVELEVFRRCRVCVLEKGIITHLFCGARLPQLQTKEGAGEG